MDSGLSPLGLASNRPDRKRDRWDAQLIKGLYLLESYEVEGFPVWWEESERVGFRAKKKLIRSKQVVDKAQAAAAKSNGENHGIIHYAEPYLKRGSGWPTMAEWKSKQSQNETVSDEDGEAKVSAQSAGAEERAAEAVKNNPELQAILAKFQPKG